MDRSPRRYMNAREISTPLIDAHAIPLLSPRNFGSNFESVYQQEVLELVQSLVKLEDWASIHRTSLLYLFFWWLHAEQEQVFYRAFWTDRDLFLAPVSAESKSRNFSHDLENTIVPGHVSEVKRQFFAKTANCNRMAYDWPHLHQLKERKNTCFLLVGWAWRNQTGSSGKLTWTPKTVVVFFSSRRLR